MEFGVEVDISEMGMDLDTAFETITTALTDYANDPGPNGFRSMMAAAKEDAPWADGTEPVEFESVEVVVERPEAPEDTEESGPPDPVNEWDLTEDDSSTGGGGSQPDDNEGADNTGESGGTSTPADETTGDASAADGDTTDSSPEENADDTTGEWSGDSSPSENGDTTSSSDAPQSEGTKPVLEDGATQANEGEGGGVILDGKKGHVRIDNSTANDALKDGDAPGEISIQVDLRLDNKRLPDGRLNPRPPGCGVAGCGDGDGGSGDRVRASNANKTILVIRQLDKVTGKVTKLELRVGENEYDAILVVTDSHGNENVLRVPDAFVADESCTADGSTCQVTTSVNEHGRLILGVNDAVFACSAGMAGFPDKCKGGVSSGGNKADELGMDASETAVVTEVLVGCAASDPALATDTCVSGVVKKVAVYDEALKRDDIVATAPSRAPSSSPSSSPSLAICANGVKDEYETDVDCGGICPGTCGFESGCCRSDDCEGSRTCNNPGANCVASDAGTLGACGTFAPSNSPSASPSVVPSASPSTALRGGRSSSGASSDEGGWSRDGGWSGGGSTDDDTTSGSDGKQGGGGSSPDGGDGGGKAPQHDGGDSSGGGGGSWDGDGGWSGGGSTGGSTSGGGGASSEEAAAQDAADAQLRDELAALQEQLAGLREDIASDDDNDEPASDADVVDDELAALRDQLEGLQADIASDYSSADDDGDEDDSTTLLLYAGFAFAGILVCCFAALFICHKKREDSWKQEAHVLRESIRELRRSSRVNPRDDWDGADRDADRREQFSARQKKLGGAQESLFGIGGDEAADTHTRSSPSKGSKPVLSRVATASNPFLLRAAADKFKSKTRRSSRKHRDKAWKDAMSDLDAEGNGELDFEAFKAACGHHDGVYNAEDQEASIRTLFDLLDEDLSGSVDVQEIAHSLRHNVEALDLAKHFGALHKFVELATIKSRRKEFKEAFKRLDASGNGELDYEAFKAVCDHDGSDEDTDVKALFDLIDEDHGGSIDVHEMLHVLKHNPAARELAKCFESLHTFVELSAGRKHKKKRKMSDKRKRSILKRKHSAHSVHSAAESAAEHPGGTAGGGFANAAGAAVQARRSSRRKGKKRRSTRMKRKQTFRVAETSKSGGDQPTDAADDDAKKKAALVTRLEEFYKAQGVPENAAKAELIITKCLEKFGSLEAAESGLNQSLERQFNGKHLGAAHAHPAKSASPLHAMGSKKAEVKIFKSSSAAARRWGKVRSQYTPRTARTERFRDAAVHVLDRRRSSSGTASAGGERHKRRGTKKKSTRKNTRQDAH